MTKSNLFASLYFALAVIGLVATWFFNIQYFAASGNPAFTAYMATLLVNPATTAVTIDIYVCAVVFSIWIFRESKRVQVKWPIAYVFLSFGIGLGFALPLYLGFRELALARSVPRGNLP
jgi:Terpene cyclase DEP1